MRRNMLCRRTAGIASPVTVISPPASLPGGGHRAARSRAAGRASPRPAAPPNTVRAEAAAIAISECDARWPAGRRRTARARPPPRPGSRTTTADAEPAERIDIEHIGQHDRQQERRAAEQRLVDQAEPDITPRAPQPAQRPVRPRRRLLRRPRVGPVGQCRPASLARMVNTRCGAACPASGPK